jgi:hypothetical protein
MTVRGKLFTEITKKEGNMANILENLVVVYHVALPLGHMGVGPGRYTFRTSDERATFVKEKRLGGWALYESKAIEINGELFGVSIDTTPIEFHDPNVTKPC